MRAVSSVYLLELIAVLHDIRHRDQRAALARSHRPASGTERNSAGRQMRVVLVENVVAALGNPDTRRDPLCQISQNLARSRLSAPPSSLNPCQPCIRIADRHRPEYLLNRSRASLASDNSPRQPT